MSTEETAKLREDNLNLRFDSTQKDIQAVSKKLDLVLEANKGIQNFLDNLSKRVDVIEREKNKERAEELTRDLKQLRGELKPALVVLNNKWISVVIFTLLGLLLSASGIGDLILKIIKAFTG